MLMPCTPKESIGLKELLNGALAKLLNPRLKVRLLRFFFESMFRLTIDVLLVLLLLTSKSCEGWAASSKTNALPLRLRGLHDFDQVVIAIMEQHHEVVRQDW